MRLLATDRCRVAAPWFAWSRGEDPTSKLRRLAVELECARLPGVTGFERAVAAVAYLPLSLVSIVRGLRTWGRALKFAYGISYARQFIQLWAYAWRLGESPRMYYHLRLHRHSWRKSGREFIDQPELHHLQRHISPVDLDALEDKIRFSHRARAQKLALVPVLSLWRGGQQVSDEDGSPIARLPARDLFIKPADGYSSSGVMGLRYDSAKDLYREETREWARDELEAHLATRSQTQSLLVQPWLGNHPSLRGFSETALCNFRIVTARHPNGPIVPVMAALRFPWKSRVSCAEPGVTLCASVDLKSGALRAAEAKAPEIGRLIVHPVTGQQIEGFVVKEWDDLLATAMVAHHQWPEFPFIGWDVAHAAEGIFILEGSCLWGATLAQMSGSSPIGLTPFASIYLEHLAQRHAESRRE
jgi:hypothetical protein